MSQDTRNRQMINHLELTGFRSARALQLPPNWTRGRHTRGRLSVSIEAHQNGDHRICLTAYMRGHSLSADAAINFATMLGAGPHELDDLERRRIVEVLDEQALRTRFSLEKVRVDFWRGKMVVITEGFYTQSGDRAFTLFCDAVGDGCWIEQYQYTAPAAKFQLHFAEAVATLRSINWFV